MRKVIKEYFSNNSLNKKECIAVYSGIFFLFALTIYIQFSINGKGPFYSFDDGLPAYYPTIGYIGEYVRTVVYNIFIKHSFIVPFYDFRFGLGEDIFRLMWSGLLNPVVIFVAPFFCINNTEICYWIICFMQMYLSGLAFILFCLYKKIDGIASICGALIYISSGFMLLLFLRHYLLVSGMVLLPLMLISLEELLKGKSPYFFISMVAVAIMMNFYFTYMITIILFVYSILLFFDKYKNDRINIFFKLFFRCSMSYLLGVMLAAPFFLPIVYRYLRLERGDGLILKTGSLLLYSKDAILYRVISLFSPMISYGSVISLSFIAMMCLFYKNSNRRGFKCFKLFFIMSLAGIFIPAIGYFFNGAGYVADRWMFLISFIFAYTFSMMSKDLLSMSKKEEIFCLYGIAVYATTIVLAHIFTSIKINVYSLSSLIFMLISMICFSTISQKNFSYPNRKAFLLILVLFCCVVRSYFWFSPKYQNYIKGHGNSGINWSFIKDSSVFYTDYLKQDDVTSFYRCDNTLGMIQDVGCLWPILSEQNGVSNYGSLTNPIFVSSQKILENIDVRHAWKYMGFDQRSALLSIASVKYFTASGIDTRLKPYGFVMKEEKNGKLSGKKYNVFENSYFLPLGYTYDNYITASDYNFFPGVSKEEILIQSVVLEKELDGMEKNSNLQLSNKKIPYKINKSDDLEWEGSILKVREANSAMSIVLNSEINSAMYLRISGLNVKNVRKHFHLGVTIGEDNIKKNLLLIPDTVPWYLKREDYLINLGYYKDKANITCKINWPVKGTFKLDDIQVYAQPMDNYPAQINKLREDVLENIYVGNDKVSGTISLKKNKILCLSIPYSKGWRAKVDGKKAELLKANSLFMALPLEAGKHKIELEYHVPGFRLGLCFFALGAAILSAMFIHDIRKQKLIKGNNTQPQVQG